MKRATKGKSKPAIAKTKQNKKKTKIILFCRMLNGCVDKRVYKTLMQNEKKEKLI